MWLQLALFRVSSPANTVSVLVICMKSTCCKHRDTNPVHCVTLSKTENKFQICWLCSVSFGIYTFSEAEQCLSVKGTHWRTGSKVLVSNARKSLKVRVRVDWVMGLTQIVAQIGEVGGQRWDSVFSEWPRGRSCLWIWRWLTSRRLPSGQRLCNGGTHRCSSLQQLSLFVLFLSICVFCVLYVRLPTLLYVTVVWTYWTSVPKWTWPSPETFIAHTTFRTR